ncbi:organic cation transporter protein-like [Galleria mellonella]|uniref:Organic cation transporter protein-like n=1 Tax=Galleria mellonella TaxID=7137 RepID=A0A6J1WA37_GALME|nr:organic cation transporter protein-like [Galleria mellonella]
MVLKQVVYPQVIFNYLFLYKMPKQRSVVSLDLILEELGDFGKYNILNYAFLLFPVFLAGMYGFVYVFEAPDISYRCQINNCENTENNSSWLTYAIPKVKDEYSKCERYPLRDNVTWSNATCTDSVFDASRTEECSSYIYSDEDSVVKDFDLGCQDWKRTLLGTVHNAALIISLPLTGVVSDRYGRKLALSVVSLCNGIMGLIRSFSVNYEMLLAFEFLEAVLGAGAYSTAFVFAMELVGPKGRVFGNTLINLIHVFGLMTLSGLAWWLQNWRHLLQVIYTPALLIFSYLWILNESVRWFLNKGKNEKAVNILHKAAKMNKVVLSEELLAPLYELNKVTAYHDTTKASETHRSERIKESSSLMQVVKSNVMRKRVAICSFLWVTSTFVYCGLTINSVSLAGNKYINFILIGIVEIPANIVCLLVLDKFGRKKTLISSYFLNACFCIGLSFFSKDQKWWSLGFYLCAQFFITMSYNCIYIYVSEVFPTCVRQSLLAVCSSIGRIGAALASQTPLLAYYYAQLPAISFGSMALTASILVFILPETINLPLPDTIEEAEWLSNKRKNVNHRERWT